MDIKGWRGHQPGGAESGSTETCDPRSSCAEMSAHEQRRDGRQATPDGREREEKVAQ